MQWIGDSDIMQSPVKLNKINPRLSGSRREEKSYTDRYKQKARPAAMRTPQTPRGESSHWGSLEGGEYDPSTIRIEQEADEYQIMKNEYMETELLWSKMAGETRNDIHQLREQIKGEQKTIKDMEKVLTARRAKLTTLQDRLNASALLLDATPNEDYEQYINSLQEEYDTIDAIGEREISAAREECGGLQAEEQELDATLSQLEEQISALSGFSAEGYNSSLTELLGQEERLRADMQEMQREGEEVWRGLRELEAERPIKEEVHRKYLQLYEKMFVNSELDKMGGLLEHKQEQMARLEDHGRRKGVVRQRRRQIEEIEERISKLRKELTQLELEIRQRSTILVNLHTMETQKR